MLIKAIIRLYTGEEAVKVSRQRIRMAKPVSSVVVSYLMVMGILLAFLLGLYAVVVLESFLLSF